MALSIQRLYRDRYPALSTLEGNFEVMENSYTVRVGGVRKTTEERIVKVKANTPEKIWLALERVREETKAGDSVALHHLSFMQVHDLRKMAEVIFSKTEVSKVQIHTTATRKERLTYGFIVSKKDSSYSQLLEGVEKAVGDSKAKDAIRSLRSTKDGNLLITLDKDQDAANSIKTAITNKESGLTAKMVGAEKQAIIHIRGMTENTEESHLKAAIKKQLGSWEPNFLIKQLRPMRNSTKAATVVLSAQAATKILEVGHLKVGLVRCEVEKRYIVKKCQRCWSYLHESSKCNGPDRTGCCQNCGKKGHAFDACKEEEFCAVCEQSHRIGSGRCPAFREALQKVKAADP
uniref:Uncharacterized protein LOC114349193 n=1 Tax=Diabrotica virgifera virgifera TaxID=50390 RepID=A0A6P7HIB7_DIAVI